MSSNEEFIRLHLNEDPLSLALKKVPEGVDLQWCLRQIEGYAIAKKKLPELAAIDGIWYPPRLSMEQCSSEATAKYKQSIVERLGGTSLTDLTGGFGIDFCYMAQGMQKATYVEQQEVLCETARHNFPLAGLQKSEVVNTSCEEFLEQNAIDAERKESGSIIYLDPARRNNHGEKVFSISDCTPDVSQLQGTLTHNAAYVMIKLSPMLDIAQALRQLRNVTEIHVVSVRGECKELLFILSEKEHKLTYHCVNLETSDEPFSTTQSPTDYTPELISPQQVTAGSFLFEPNASIMKAGMQNAFAERYNLKKLHPMSNLFVGERNIEGIPARQFVIEGMSDFQKAGLKGFLHGIKQANIAIRNFPSTVDELRKRLKIKDGGNVYLFATTLADNTHRLIRCCKV